MKARILKLIIITMAFNLNPSCKLLEFNNTCAYADCPMEGGYAAATVLVVDTFIKSLPKTQPPPPPPLAPLIPLDSIPVTDTGVTTCYDDTTPIACDDLTYVGQDGFFSNTPLARSFTGPTQDTTHPTDYTTHDNATGLTWTSCSLGLAGADCSVGTISALGNLVATVRCIDLTVANTGSSGYAGRKDWRLPTRHELSTIIDFGFSSPAVNSVYFPEIDTSKNYWTSSEYRDPAPGRFAWYVDFTEGSVSFANATTDSTNHVICVSPGP